VDRIYLIKNPSIWMIDELVVFSRHIHFSVIFLRRPNTFYNDRIEQLRENGTEIIYEPFTNWVSLKKLLFALGFIVKNIPGFLSWYSFVVGIKSIWWFLKMDTSYFQKPVSIHAQFATQPALIGLLLSKYHSPSKVKYFFTFHAYDIFFNNRWFVKLVNNSEKCFSISRYNIDYVLNKYKQINTAKLEIARLGAFSNHFSTTKKPKSKIFHLGFISWFVEKKGIKYLLEAMKIISTKNRNINLVLAGDGPLRKEIEQFIASNNLKDTVTYIGSLNSEGKQNFFSSIDALVLPAITLPNDQDGIPVVLMEALSYGLPIISTNISGIPEICINNFNGFLIPEKNTAALVEAILSLYSDKNARSRFSDNSLQLFNDYRIEDNSYHKLKQLNWIA
jgi:colanic acid/amylovoran biosynthesis glycosyltransferase